MANKIIVITLTSKEEVEVDAENILAYAHIKAEGTEKDAESYKNAYTMLMLIKDVGWTHLNYGFIVENNEIVHECFPACFSCLEGKNSVLFSSEVPTLGIIHASLFLDKIEEIKLVHKDNKVYTYACVKPLQPFLLNIGDLIECPNYIKNVKKTFVGYRLIEEKE